MVMTCLEILCAILLKIKYLQSVELVNINKSVITDVCQWVTRDTGIIKMKGFNNFDILRTREKQ